MFPARLFWHTRGRLRRSPRYTDRSCSARSASGLFAQIESMRASFCLDSIKKMGHLRQASKDTVLKRRVKSQRRWAIEAPMHSIVSEPGRFRGWGHSGPPAIVDLEPNAATASMALIRQREVFGPTAPISGRRPGPRGRREPGRARRGSPGVGAARTRRSESRASHRRCGSLPRISA